MAKGRQDPWCIFVLIGLLLLGCSEPGADPGAIPGPCAAGGWGGLVEGLDVLYVEPDADGDGSRDAPSGDMEGVLEFARHESVNVLLAPGIYAGSFVLGGGVVAAHYGSCPARGDVVLQGVEAPTGPGGELEAQPLVTVEAGASLSLGGLLLRDGSLSIAVHGGAQVSVEQVRVENARVAFSADGPGSSLVIGAAEISGVGLPFSVSDMASLIVHPGAHITDCDTAFSIFGAESVRIDGATIERCRRPVLYAEGPGRSDGLVIVDSVIRDWEDAAIEFVGAGAVGTIRRTRLEGGVNPIILRGAEGWEQPTLIDAVTIRRWTGPALGVYGLNSSVEVTDIDIEGENGSWGEGILASSGGSVWSDPASEILISGGRIVNAYRVGVLLEFLDFEIDGLEVRGTRPASPGAPHSISDAPGRGIQVQSRTYGFIGGALLDGNHDAGILIHKPVGVMVRDTTVTGTTARGLDGLGDLGTGDGIVVTQGGYGLPPDDFAVTFVANTLNGNARAGILAEDVRVQIGGGNRFEGNGRDGQLPALAEDTLLFQRGASVEDVSGGSASLGQYLDGSEGLEELLLHHDAD